MPNHVRSKLIIKDEETLNKLIEYMEKDNIDSDMRYMDFNKILPMPDYIYQGPLGTSEEEIYGEENCWYNWSLRNWGTKWNAYNSFADFDCIGFETAWSGVPKLMALLSQKFPNTDFEYMYADEDNGNNTARFKFNSGRVLKIEYLRDQSIPAYYNFFNCWDTRFIGPGTGYYLCADRNENGTILYCPIVKRNKE